MKQYDAYKGMEYRMDIVELPQSLKMAGVRMRDFPNFGNIDRYHSQYKLFMRGQEICAPYTEVGYSGTFGEGDETFDYIFGCQVKSFENLPEGLTAVDLGIERFAQITFRAETVEALVGGSDGPGNAMQIAGDYIKNVWLPNNLDKVVLADPDMIVFQIENSGLKLYCGMIEIYKTDIQVEPEMCFYIPLQ